MGRKRRFELARGLWSSRLALSALLFSSGAQADKPALEAASPAPAALNRTLTIPSATAFKLGNGLRVVLQETHIQPQVAVLVGYDIGSRDDPRGYADLAHLVEHMTYRGSKHLEPLGGLDVLERVGVAVQNGATAPDFTVYFSLVPARALAHALWVESERMAFTLERFDEKSLEVERSIVKNELLLRYDPRGLLEYNARRAIFGEKHPYSGGEGPGVDLDAIELDHVRWFFQQGYNPNNAIVVLVGDFDPEVARGLVERYFGPVKNSRGFPVRGTLRTAFSKGRHVILESQSRIEEMTAYWPAPSPTSPDEVAARVFARIVSGRLRKQLGDQLDWVTAIYCKIERLDLGSVFRITARLQGLTTYEQVESEIQRTLAGLARAGWDDLASAKNDMILDEILGLENLLGRAFTQFDWMRRTQRPFVVSQHIDQIRAVKAEQLDRLYHSFRTGTFVTAHLKRADPRVSLPPWGRVTVSE